jgi:hypothetical protein
MLNQYLNPSPYEFKDMDNKVECMWLGDRFHSCLQATMLMWRDKWLRTANRHIKELENMMPFTREKEVEFFIRWWAHQLVDYVCEEFRDPMTDVNSDWFVCEYVEEKRQIIIDFSWYKINFSWTSDADLASIMYEWQERWHMKDIKSAWSKWSQEKADSERQKYYYVFLKCILEWLPWCRFDYDIYTKQKKVQHQSFTYYITKEEAEKVLKQDLKLFILDNHVNK